MRRLQCSVESVASWLKILRGRKCVSFFIFKSPYLPPGTSAVPIVRANLGSLLKTHQPRFLNHTDIGYYWRTAAAQFFTALCRFPTADTDMWHGSQSGRRYEHRIEIQSGCKNLLRLGRRFHGEVSRHNKIDPA